MTCAYSSHSYAARTILRRAKRVLWKGPSCEVSIDKQIMHDIFKRGLQYVGGQAVQFCIQWQRSCSCKFLKERFPSSSSDLLSRLSIGLCASYLSSAKSWQSVGARGESLDPLELFPIPLPSDCSSQQYIYLESMIWQLMCFQPFSFVSAIENRLACAVICNMLFLL